MLTIAGLILLVVAAAMYLGISPSVPRWVKLALIVAILVSPSGLWAARYIIGLLPDPHMIWLVDVDAREPDASLFRFPARDFAELEVIEGELHQAGPSLYFGKAVNIEEMTVVGTWKGTLSDRELLTAISKIDECRGTLEDDAKRGFQIETQAFSIIRSATRSAVRSVVATFEKGTLPDEGQGLGEEIDKALEQFDLDKEIRHTDDDKSASDQEEAGDDLVDHLDDDSLADPQDSEPEVTADV
jgi:hypothetical protein